MENWLFKSKWPLKLVFSTFYFFVCLQALTYISFCVCVRKCQVISYVNCMNIILPNERTYFFGLIIKIEFICHFVSIKSKILILHCFCFFFFFFFISLFFELKIKHLKKKNTNGTEFMNDISTAFPWMRKWYRESDIFLIYKIFVLSRIQTIFNQYTEFRPCLRPLHLFLCKSEIKLLCVVLNQIWSECLMNSRFVHFIVC